MSRVDLQVTRLRPEAVLPARSHEGDAGMDLSSLERHVLAPGARAVVGTGLAVAIPEDHVGLICPRSGLAARHGISVVNGPGVVDSGYRGEVRVVLHNTDPAESFTVDVGDRIAQLVVVPIVTVEAREVDKLDDTVRAAGGFGSSGIASLH